MEAKTHLNHQIRQIKFPTKSHSLRYRNFINPLISMTQVYPMTEYTATQTDCLFSNCTDITRFKICLLLL